MDELVRGDEVKVTDEDFIATGEILDISGDYCTIDIHTVHESQKDLMGYETTKVSNIEQI